MLCRQNCGLYQVSQMNARLEELTAKYDQLCSVVSATWPPLLLSSNYDGSPHVEWRENKYHLISNERGIELRHLETDDLEQILYWLLSDFVEWLSSDFEFHHRKKGADFRRTKFMKEIELMERLNSEWGKAKKFEIEERLNQRPYDDRRYG